jgi:hypothetical protein
MKRGGLQLVVGVALDADCVMPACSLLSSWKIRPAAVAAAAG